MSCLCGHASELHRDKTENCLGTYSDFGIGRNLSGKAHPCDCTVYEPDAAEAEERAHDEEPA